jgi:hypothetical protein
MHPDDRADYTRRVFHDQVEWFIKKYAPSRDRDPYEHFELIADFCLVIRDLGVQGQQAYCDVATKAMKQSHELISLIPTPPIIVPKDK